MAFFCFCFKSPETLLKFLCVSLKRKKKKQDWRVRRDRNNGVAALLMLTQFKAFVMKRGFMLILLIRHADVLDCYALEQGTCTGLIACDPRRQSDSPSLSLFPFFPFTYSKCVCWEKDIVIGNTLTCTDLCTSTHLFHLCTLI